jgi:hypothetical protein
VLNKYKKKVAEKKMKKITMLTIVTMLSCAGTVFAKDSFFSTVNINIAGGVGGVWGDPISEEKKTKLSVTYSDGTTKSSGPDHIMWNAGIWCDITPFDPFMNDAQNTGVKFGLRGRLGYYFIEQNIEVGGGSYEKVKKDSKYMSFKSAMIGPVIRWAPYISQKESGPVSKFVVTAFMQAGPIFGGTMRPGPILQDEGYLPKLESKISGLRMELGTGIEFSGGTMVHFGTNFYYARNMIKMSPNYYTNVPSRTVIHEFGAELYAGLSF